jgi:hypothetical protein
LDLSTPQAVTQSSRAVAFALQVRLEVDVDGARFFERSWQEVIPRDHV